MSTEDQDVKVDRGDDVAVVPEVEIKSPADLAEELVETKAEEVEPKKVEDDKPSDKKAAKEKNDNRIPQSRLDDITRKNREALQKKDEEIAKLREAVSRNKMSEDIETLRNRIDELDDKYEEMVADGKTADAKALRKEIRGLEDVYNRSIAVANSEAASRAAVEQMRYDTTLATLESQYPALNPDDEAFDETVADEVLEVMEGLRRAGSAKSDALRRAVKYVLGNPAAPVDDTEAKGLRENKREEAVKRGLEAKSKQPPSTDGLGLDSDKAGSKDKKVDVLKLTQKQFAELDEAALSRLRGDEL